MAKKAGIASFVGTSVEWYDFYTYGTASALVLGPLFFSQAEEGVAVLLAFATFWVGFIARPLGGIIFGHFGDKVGRKKALITTLLMMGFCTFAVGLLPTYAAIGITAPILLITIRLIQGIAMGGEWGGAVVLAAEHAPKGKGILYSAFAQQGSPAGNLMATVAWLLVSMLPDDQFTSWGWRLPFLFSAVLVFVGLYIRLSIEESPSMKAVMADNAKTHQKKIPLVELLKTSKRFIALGIGTAVISVSAIYFKGTFALAWVVDHKIFDRQTFLTLTTIAIAIQFIIQPFGALLAHRIDVKKAVIILLLPEVILMPIMFPMISTGNFWIAMIGMALATIPHSTYTSFMAGILAKSFPPAIRYTGISLSYQLSATLFGGTAPMISQWLLNTTGSIYSVVVLSVIYVVITVGSAVGLLSVAARRGHAYGDADTFSDAE